MELMEAVHAMKSNGKSCFKKVGKPMIAKRSLLPLFLLSFSVSPVDQTRT
jgi:hypothetical protein